MFQKKKGQPQREVLPSSVVIYLFSIVGHEFPRPGMVPGLESE
jgi:hypothetical protein